jgi:hypothetical protein
MPSRRKNRRLRRPRKTIGDQSSRLARHSVPDLRDPKVLADLRRQGKLLAQHPENDAIDDFIDAS